ncbi:type II toxin-antitoxin system VapC family toxin [Spirosoma terrae]|uniref:Type II toxin-antitoxin system VapC family toxin n=1 Tax=Spirosoma terrae TaxID=1968276 RepID=A0A6L9LFF4_9BACT|nr:type II toxin-antitoxin system VapC family toxin [Spirosoma terrae]NDU99335.1 type II toxin-antitoxin system VapC family toxin [Spirosoma terrae]
MSQYLLDTNICIHFIKGEYDLRNKIQKVGFQSCYISEITIAELLYGVENSAPDRRSINLQRVKNLRASFADRVIPIGECLEEYAKQKAQLRRVGRRVEDLDIFIGATSIVKNLVLITRNTKDFVNMGNLTLENWIDY